MEGDRRGILSVEDKKEKVLLRSRYVKEEEIVFERFRGFVIEGKKCENFLHPCEHFMETMKDFFQKERYVSVQTMRF